MFDPEANNDIRSDNENEIPEADDAAQLNSQPSAGYDAEISAASQNGAESASLQPAADDTHIVRENIGTYSDEVSGESRVSYSDAGYIPVKDAAPTPRYYSPEPEQVRPPKKAKSQKKISIVSAIAICLICAIIGGCIGGFASGIFAGGSDTGAEGSSASRSLVLQTAPPLSDSGNSYVPAVTASKADGTEMAATDIYTMACRQVVGITTEITYTNVFGMTSSGAVTGSGFIISSDGYILTNYHVIEDALAGGYDISVMLFNGDSYTASIIGAEEDNDVAVLKIDADNLNPVTLGNSENMRVGETVYAVGNPLGELSYTMTSGIVSATDREISTDASTTINMFQLDCAVNSGNSGGPAYNSGGQVIGIITAKYSSTGVEGIGFAIPINDAVAIANELIENGYIGGKAYFGISVDQNFNSVAQRYYSLPSGAYVAGVTEGSCAESAGLQPGDIITKLDNTEITSYASLVSAKKLYHAGDSAVITVYRSGSYIELQIVFDEEVPSSQTSLPNNSQQNQSVYGR